MSNEEYERFEDLTYDEFRRLATDETLSRYERIGFPNDYRENQEHLIFHDIRRKLPLLDARNQNVLDIGSGCSDLPHMLIDLCEAQGHNLWLADSAEMLGLLPEKPFIQKIVGPYPDSAKHLFEEYAGKIDVILAYSVFQYIYAEQNPFRFIDYSVGLLSEGGQMLIGDIPNRTMRKRFFASGSGIRCHQEFTQSNSVPEVHFNTLEEGAIDDSVVLSIFSHSRQAGFHCFVVPQAPDLPMASRREDIIITRP